MLHPKDWPIPGESVEIRESSRESTSGQRDSAASATLSAATVGTKLGRGGKTVLPLKRGQPIDARLGLATYQSLTRLFEQDSQLFSALRAVAEGRPDTVAPEQMTVLRYGMFLHQDFSIRDAVRDVLLSAYQETAEGPVLANPFDLQSLNQAILLKQLESAGLDRLIRLLWRDDRGMSR